MSACTCPCPECGDINAEVMKACRVLQADLDAAQDEIERLLSEIAALRIERDNLRRPSPHTPDGPRGFGLGTSDDQVTIHDRHGCEVVLSPAVAMLTANTIIGVYGGAS